MKKLKTIIKQKMSDEACSLDAEEEADLVRKECEI
jgi:hypothetical protein